MTDISEYSGELVQIAFHYYGDQYDDKWYIDDVSSSIWRTSYDNYHTGATSAVNTMPNGQEDRYLVSPPILLP